MEMETGEGKGRRGGRREKEEGRGVFKLSDYCTFVKSEPCEGKQSFFFSCDP